MKEAINERSWFERLSQALLREPKDREQLVTLLRDAEQRKLLDANALSMIEGVLLVSEMQVRDIMIPRTQMITIAENDAPEIFLPIILESAHSRFPVIGDNRDEVIGILLAKDCLHMISNPENFDLHEMIRPAYFVPESKRLDKLLAEFRQTHNHMAIVVDEYGSVAGCVTIEDILEQIVGEIEDEFDVDDESYIKKHHGMYIVKALTPVEEFNQFFNSKFSDENFDTIGGLVVHKFGHLPKRGEKITLGQYEFEVLHADNRKVRLLKLTVSIQQV